MAPLPQFCCWVAPPPNLQPKATSKVGEDRNANGGSVEIGRIAGYFNIPVEQVTIACDAEPDRPVSELLGEESRRQGASRTGDDAKQGKEAAAEAQTGVDAENADAEMSGSGGSSQ